MGYDIVIYIIYALRKVTLPEWLTGSPAIQQSGWSLTASVRIAQVTFFLLRPPVQASGHGQIYYKSSTVSLT